MPPEYARLPLEVVDGLQLDASYREVLQPGAILSGENGQEYTLPRWFFRVESAQQANEVMLSPHFHLREFLDTDFREAPLLKEYPKYVPLAVTLTASVLELFRRKVGTLIRIAANGGYRSPAHALNSGLTTHCWGTAVNLLKVGSRRLDNAANHEKYAQVLQSLAPGAWVRPHGFELGNCFDQMHIDLGFTVVTPRQSHRGENHTDE